MTKRFHFLGGIALFGFTLAAWGPLLRHYLPVDNDFVCTEMLAQHGVWRVLGRHAVIWTVSLPGVWPGATTVLVHFAACVALFIACLSVWGNRPVALVVAIAYCIYPWGYGLLTTGWAWLLAAEACFLWLVVAWTVSKCRHPQSCRWFELPLLSLSVVAAIATQERLSICYPLLTAWALWVLWSQGRHGNNKVQLKAFAVVMAPLIGFALYTALYFATKQSDLNAPGFHLPAVLSAFVKQLRHYHHFVPLMSPGTWPIFVFYEWSAKQSLIILAAGFCGLTALAFALRAAVRDGCETQTDGLGVPHKIGLAAALLMGAATIFVMAGGYSDEIYKRYPLGSVLAFAICGFLSIIPAATRTLFSVPGKVALACLGVVFVFTDWLHAGIWRYEVRSLYSLVDLIQRDSLPIPAKIKWASEPRAFWPQLNTMTEAMRTGECLSADVREIYVTRFRLTPPDVSPENSAFYTAEAEWIFWQARE